MATACIPQIVFDFGKKVVVKFDTPHTSPDGGAVLLKRIDDSLGVTRALASCLLDPRQPGKTHHGIIELVRQRVFALALGYADCNDAVRLSQDPVHKWLLERDPFDGRDLASQPTLSRLENAVGPYTLARMGHALADLIIGQHSARLGGRARRITIDLDPTEDPTHGQQEFTFFNGHYDSWCYLPLLGTITFNDESEQYPVLALLRAGNAPAKLGAITLLRNLFGRLREAFRGVRLRVRLDGGFAGEDMLQFLESEGVEYTVAIGGNKVLDKRIRRLMGRVHMLAKKTDKSVQLFGDTRYAAKKWSRKRRVIMKAEVVRHPGREPRDNPRFVVTNLPHTPEHVYEIYRQRGDMENRIKEFKDGVALDRLSCHRFAANQFRLLLVQAAYILMQALREHATGTSMARGQISTLRQNLLKIGVRIERSVRRIVMHFPESFPWRAEWQQLAFALGAVP